MAGCRFPEKRAEARRRRRQGVPLKRIAAELDAAVSTIHSWTRAIRLTPEQEERNRTGPGAPHNPEWIAKRANAWREKNRRRRLAYQSEGRDRAQQGDPLHMAGCMLYWAEGAKARNVLAICNADPGMIRFFARFLREALDVSSSRLRVTLNVYTNNGLSLKEIENHWLGLLDLPRTSLRRHQLNTYPTSSSGRRKKLPYGTCTLSVAKSTRELQHIFGAIQEYAGFEQPAWLDGPPRKARPRGSGKRPL